MSTKLPKIIYQTWYTKTLPPQIQAIVDNMLAVNSGYEYRFFDDVDMLAFIESNYDSTIVNCFNLLKIGAAKADLWRYLVLYKNGGIYLDVDSVIHSKLDDLIMDDGCSIISRETNPGLFVQWCLMFVPNHPILKICIDFCVENILSKKNASILEITGPVVYSKAIKKFFNDEDVYNKPDEFVNASKHMTKARFYSFDYRGFADFLHPYKNLLYTNKMHWSVEQRNQKF